MKTQRSFDQSTCVVVTCIGVVGSNLWEWRLASQQRGELIYWSFRNVVLQKVIKNFVDATQDEWVDFVQVKSWQRTSGSCEIIKVGILRSYDTEIRKSGEGNRSRMCTRLHKSWLTTPALDRWHRWMDWDEDQRSGYSSGRSWSLERDTTRRQEEGTERRRPT